MKKNLDLRIESLKSGVPLCRIAENIGVERSTFYSRLSRSELTDSEKGELYLMLERLADDGI